MPVCGEDISNPDVGCVADGRAHEARISGLQALRNRNQRPVDNLCGADSRGVETLLAYRSAQLRRERPSKATTAAFAPDSPFGL